MKSSRRVVVDVGRTRHVRSMSVSRKTRTLEHLSVHRTESIGRTLTDVSVQAGLSGVLNCPVVSTRNGDESSSSTSQSWVEDDRRVRRRLVV